MKRRGIIRVDQINDAVLQRAKRIKRLPGQILFEVLPHPFDRIDLRRVRRLKQENDILGDAQVLGRMTARIVEEDDVDARCLCLRKRVQKELHMLGIQLREPNEEAISTGGGDEAIQVEVLEPVLIAPDGFDAPGRNPPPPDRLQAEATLISRPNFDGFRRLWREHLSEMGRRVTAEGGHRLSVFFGDSDEVP